MLILWPNNADHNEVLLFVSGAALYMKKSGEYILAFYPIALHVICLANTFHNVCEEVHANYSNVNRLIAKMKRFFNV